MIKIRHDILVADINLYYLNGVRVWFSQITEYVHVGTKMNCSLYMSTDNGSVRMLVKSLMSETGKLKIDVTDPIVKKFLEVTNCI